MTPAKSDPQLDQVLQALQHEARGALADNFVGAYLQGSLAVGGFDQHSDVDFVFVTQDELTNVQVGALREAHGKLYDLDMHWAKHLEGSYFPKAVLRDPKWRGEPLWYLDHGSRMLHDLKVSAIDSRRGGRVGEGQPGSLLVGPDRSGLGWPSGPGPIRPGAGRPGRPGSHAGIRPARDAVERRIAGGTPGRRLGGPLRATQGAGAGPKHWHLFDIIARKRAFPSI